MIMKNKRLLSFVLPLVCCPLIGCNFNYIIDVPYSTYKDKNGYSYQIMRNKEYERFATLTDVEKGTEKVIVPDEIKGVPVLKVNFSKYDNLSDVTELVLGRNVTNFNVTTNHGSKSYSLNHNNEYEDLSYESVWPRLEIFSSADSQITYIPDFCFIRSKRLTDIYLNEGLTKIGSAAFFECSELRNFKMPNSIETITDEAFKGCKNLNTNLKLSNNIKELGAAFRGTNIITDYASKDTTEIVLYTNNGQKCLIHKVIEGYGQDFVFNYDVVGSRAFSGGDSGYYSQQSITFNTRSFSHHAFYDNDTCRITNLNLYSVDYIGDYAFYSLRIENIFISGNVQKIGDYAISGYEIETIVLKDYGNSNYVSYQNVLYEKQEEGCELMLLPRVMQGGVLRLHENTTSIHNSVNSFYEPFERIEISNFSLFKMFPESEDNYGLDYTDHQTDFFRRFRYNLPTKSYAIFNHSNRFRIVNNCICDGNKLVLAPRIEESTYMIDPSVTTVCSNSFYKLDKTTSFKFSRSVTEIGQNVFGSVDSPYEEFYDGYDYYYYNYHVEYKEVALYIPKEVTKIDGSIIESINNSETKIAFYVEAISKPEGWNDDWCKVKDHQYYKTNELNTLTVHWGCAFDY